MQILFLFLPEIWRGIMKVRNRKRLIKWLWLIVFSPIAIALVSLLMVGIFADIPSFEELEDPKSWKTPKAIWRPR